MSALVRRIESIVPRKADAFGGKAKNLAALARAGFPVPAAYALEAQAAADFFEAALPEADQPGALLTAPQRALTDTRLTDLRAQALAAPLPPAVVSALREALSALKSEGAVAVAVRSSSTREDQEASSAAGLHETVLGVQTEEELFDAVRACWSSVLTRSAISYLRTLPLDEARRAGIGIVVQAMVPAEVAGALFTVNPLSGDPGEMVINASYGLGNLVMDGRVSPDTYRVDKATGWVRDRVVGEKALAARWLPGGVTEEEVPEPQRELECLGEDLLGALVDLGRRVEGHFDDARDIEWAAVGGTLFLLQARPVTALSRPPRRRASKRRAGRERGRIVWSNVNVGEALPGVATPMTWSVLSDFSERGFRRAFGSLGCKVPRDAELVGSFRGRIYLNLTEFMEIASQVPGLRPKTLLALGGGGEGEHLEMQVESRGSTGFMMRLPLTVARYVRQNAGLTERVKRFDASFSEERGRLLAIDFRVLSSTGLDRVLHRVERLLDDSGLVMLNVYGNLLATVLLMRGVLQVVFRERAERLERELLTGLSDVESAAPGLTLWHIAETARAEDAAREVLLAHEAAALRVALLPEGPTRRALERFFTAYGYRGAREAEIAEPRWGEDPTLPFATLRAHLLRKNGHNPLDIERRQRAVRDRAAAELERRMPGPAKVAMRHLLSLVQRFTRLRERLRSHVVQVLGLYRAVGLDASRRMMVREPGIGPGAAFYLSVEELHAFLRGDVERVEPLVSRRRLQLERDRALPDPPDTFVGFPPAPTGDGAPADALTGLAACSGRVVGKARVLMSPADADTLEAGEILVAPYADVGWSPLFLVAGAVVTDLGGPLSHAAVVAREYGVPTVVNVKGGTRSIQTGDELEVDGAAGTVRVLSRAH
ncbi:MAG: PEP/pyruvate-binding domain-containing protein [Myxococcota bacterium]|nr:PEP/pyruvate-binding domain-containing protein [Myxococcota bacterium]